MNKTLTAIVVAAVLLGALGGAYFQFVLPNTQNLPVEQASDLTYFTEQYAPFNYQKNGTLKGLSVELLEAIFGNMGANLSRNNVRVVNWTDGYRTALSSKNTMLFSMARIPEREASFKWVGPILNDPQVLFAVRGRNISISSDADLARYKICTSTDAVTVQKLLDHGVPLANIITYDDSSNIPNELKNGTVDLWAYGEQAGKYITKQALGEYDYFANVYSIGEIQLYFAFNRNTSDSLVQSFQHSLDSLKQKGAQGTPLSEYDKIIGRHIPSKGLSYVTYYTEQYPPYNYIDNGTMKGISIELLNAVLERLNVSAPQRKINMTAWTDGYQAALTQDNTAVFSTARVSAREDKFKWAGPIGRCDNVLFALKGRNITVQNTSDISRYHIGVITGDIATQDLLDMGISNQSLVSLTNASDIIAGMESNQIDMWAYAEAPARLLIKQFSSKPDDYAAVYTLRTNQYYFAFNKNVSDVLVDAFQEALYDTRSEKDLTTGISDYERILYRYVGASAYVGNLTDVEVTALVNKTAADIQADAQGTFRNISAGRDPYKNATNGELYAFVYDTNITIVAHADNMKMVGVSLRNKTDAAGKPFRNQIVEGALANGTGWVDYIYTNPVRDGLYYKKSYYKLVTGSDGERYIVCSGNYV
ncbi:MAG: transporter substrate-binding domain-containing protein [Thermoplasmata archaeon]